MEAAVALRTYGLSIMDIGSDRLTWGEAYLLLKAAATDTSTRLGAELAGFAYPASMPQLYMLLATISDRDAAMSIMPWSVREREEQKKAHAVTQSEMDVAAAALDAEIVIAS